MFHICSSWLCFGLCKSMFFQGIKIRYFYKVKQHQIMAKYTFFLTVLFLLFFHSTSMSQPDVSATTSPRFDLSTEPVLYTIGYAHLDTEWRWDYEATINTYLKATLDDNFKYIEKYKGYVFNFSGARRYKMMKEYYPERYERMKKYIAQGKWFVSGSSVDECDANVPSPESIIRQVLYGNNYFRAEYGKESVDFILPDCFGFQAHLPSALAHAGLKGFSTQKLSWGSANGIPFNIGRWVGLDGKGVVAALNATNYGGTIEPGMDTAKYWVDRVMTNGKKYGIYADLRYYGTGDIGGAPEEKSIKNGVALSNSLTGKFRTYLSSSDQLFRDLKPEQVANLPQYTGDLLLTQHSAGSLTSQSYMKRWNRKNELLAQATEPLAAAASWLGGQSYPLAKMNQAWWLVLGSQMHDILPGTCIPSAYDYAWNDEVLALNLFSSQLLTSAGVVIRGMDTRTTGKALVVYNPLAISREDVVEAEVSFPEGAPENILVTDPTGKEVTSQLLSKTKTSVKILFIATVPSFGLVCYDVQPAEKSSAIKNPLNSGSNFIENEYYKVMINVNGDVFSIVDKKQTKELLSAPIRMEFLKEHPEYWPAWNMDWADRKNPPVGFVDTPLKITLVEKGPVRVTFSIERAARNSYFVQNISLVAGDAGKRVLFRNRVDWQSKGVSLKASFPLMASNNMATYNLGMGTIERPNNEEKKYEVPSREWFDLTDKTGNLGVTILEDCKFGSDKPDDKTLRLTLLYTPTTNSFHDQATQDWGTHEFTYGVYSHKSDWRVGKSEWQGRSLNQPLVAFQVNNHPGFLGKTFSILQVNTPQVDVRAMKKAEVGNETIIRLQELHGKEIQKVEVTLPSKITSCYEVDGQEKKIGDAVIVNGKLTVDMTAFATRSFALQMASPLEKMTEPTSIPIPLTFDQDVVSGDKNKKDGGFDEKGLAIPAELFPEKATIDGVVFVFGSKTDQQKNALTCSGQKIPLPKTGNYNRVYILAAATKDTTGLFKAGESRKSFRVQAYTGKIGQFDRRVWDKLDRIERLEQGYIKREQVAYYSTHLHKDTVNVPHQYGYIFKYAMDISPSAGSIQLPNNEAIKIFAITLADNPYDQATAAQPLYDDFTGRKTINLVLDHRIVSETMVPLAKTAAETGRKLSDLPYKVTMKDYADMHMPNGVVFNYYFSGTEKKSKNQPEQGQSVPSLNDGMFDLLPSDSLKDTWFEKGEGRIVMDMQRSTTIDSLHLFAVTDGKRGPQVFSIWASEKDNLPSVTGDPKPGEWSYIARAYPVEIWGNGKVVYSIVPEKGKVLSARYLMWISEESQHGPFYFREVDVFAQ
jgi:alpha-mannosidase